VHLVTGARGFLGFALVERLVKEGEVVRGLVRPSPGSPAGSREVAGDLLDEASLARAVEGCTTVFHLAGKAHDLSASADAEFERTNVEGTANLLRAAERARVRTVVFVSSVKAMGEGGDACLDEDSPAEPATPYGRSKLVAERLVEEFGPRTGAHVAVLRLPLVYGAGLKGNLLRMLQAIDRGTFPPLPAIPNKRSLASVEDVTNALLLAARLPAAAGRRYLVTDGVAYSSGGIRDAMRAAFGKPPVRRNMPMPLLSFAARIGDAATALTGRAMPFDSRGLEKLTGSAWYSNARIRRELGFEPATNLREALPAIVASLRGGA
jgi:UDP-glucose 4-epimerase